MPRSSLRTWQDFAKAASQEQDPKKLTHLIKQLHRALDEDEEMEKARPKRLKSGRAA